VDNQVDDEVNDEVDNQRSKHQNLNYNYKINYPKDLKYNQKGQQNVPILLLLSLLICWFLTIHIQTFMKTNL
jgi:hypothetical protein